VAGECEARGHSGHFYHDGEEKGTRLSVWFDRLSTIHHEVVRPILSVVAVGAYQTVWRGDKNSLCAKVFPVGSIATGERMMGTVLLPTVQRIDLFRGKRCFDHWNRLAQ
jgi:hypothetical protein